VRRLVHDDHGTRAERRFQFAHAVKIHRSVENVLALHHWARGPAGNNRQQIVPAAAHAMAVLFDDFAEGDAHRLFNHAGRVDVADQHEQLGADIVRPADGRKPRSTPAQYRGRHRDGLHIVDRGRTAIEADIGGERRLQARLAFLAFEALEQGRLLAADIGACAVVDIDIEIVAVLVVLADQLRVIGLIDRALQGLALADELAAHVDIGRPASHGETGHKAPLHPRVGIMAQYVAILAGSGLGLVGVDYEIAWAAVALLAHEGPLQAGRETRPAAAAQAGGLHLVDDPVAPLVDQALGIVPDAARHGALQRLVEAAVNVGEDA